MAAERGATGLWQRGGYECSCSGASHSQRTLGRWQAASPAELPRRQRRAARILTVCMARGARLAVRSVVRNARFPGSCAVMLPPCNIAPMCSRPEQALCRSREEAHDKEQRHRAPGLGAGAHAESAVPGAAGHRRAAAARAANRGPGRDWHELHAGWRGGPLHPHRRRPHVPRVRAARDLQSNAALCLQ